MNLKIPSVGGMATIGPALFSLLCVPASAAPLSANGLETYRYVVKSGDTLYKLAQDALVRRTDIGIVRRLNHVADPLHLRVGRELLIPRKLLRTVKLEGRVIAFRGAVLAQKLPVHLGSIVREGDNISTGAHAFLSVALGDGSTLTLPSQSAIRIDHLRQVVLSGEQDRVFVISTGPSEMSVTPFRKPGERFEIHTPVSVAAVRGTKFRVAVLADGVASSTSVMSGVVAVNSDNSNVLLSENYGVRATATRIATAGLLAAPAFMPASNVQSGDRLEFVLEPVAKASAYRVQIAKDAGFLDIIEEELSTRTRVALDAVPDGTYFARASVVDQLGIEGRSRSTAFERYLNGLRTSVERGRGRRQYAFRWLDVGGGKRIYRFALTPVSLPGHPLIDEAGLTRRDLTLVDLPPGEYSWRVMTTSNGNSAWSEPNILSVPAVTRQSVKRPHPITH